ncbi:YihY/virulence factor BrkB family protein [Microbacterium sp. zg.Y1090]|uniref:YihY/virulence factor BrkB family protein n=1 Tax=Microbacterium TaxID=33882 RepID=UPI00214C7F94|nr:MULTISPECIES: YihY/virulence factor BrkB family protein [unclassified Microbacterium]MCR2814134.1 YihY/virulence factor BrkB family protein [Microbacterium sp. zg.Y1084]MCR2819890.1 YihY/virulence factor BrkB family protein [Microbacterium sp. zg.Y1090]MDL5488001.1 YihY/virulence factor BrkB family protein [Microbacterium sp. zg-Y1211]WIM27477.1 YihY/virulence factor BrkB family protein [Microbacterium sp. zg-Y1090]
MNLPRVIAWALSIKPVRALLLYLEHRGPVLADSVTYRTLFSVFAGVLLGFSVAGLWLAGNPAAFDALIDAVDSVIPGIVGDGGIIEDPRSVAVPVSFTVTGILSFVGLIGAAIGAVGTLRAAIRMIADRVTEDLMIVWVLLRNLALAIGIGLGLVAAAAITFLGTTGLAIVADWFGVSSSSALLEIGGRALTIVVVFVLDTAIVAASFRVLSGLRASARALWSGAVVGGIGLTVLQVLSGLFVGGASANPLLATFASLIALLLWFNLSAQVILIASAYIVTGVEEEADRVRARYGAQTFAQRRVRRAENAVVVASGELDAARDAEAEERRAAQEKAEKASEKVDA